MLRPGFRWLKAADPGQPVAATLLLRPPADLSEQLLSGQFHPPSRETAEQAIAASPRDIAAVRQFAAEHGLEVKSEDAKSRRIVLTGTAQQMDAAFGVQVGEATDANSQTVQSYQGEVQLPDELRGIVTAVLGLDQSPVARHAGQS